MRLSTTPLTGWILLREPYLRTQKTHGLRSGIVPTSLFCSNSNEDFLANLGELLENEAFERKEQEKNNKYENTYMGGWRTIDWRKQFFNQQLSPESLAPQSPIFSPVERTLVRNRLVYFKRDDLLRLSGGAPISGNKARKMIALNDLDASKFPACVVSYGGPQSNAMLALAAIVHFKNQEALAQQSNITDAKPLKRFVYFTKRLPRFLRRQPNGNLFRAQTLGMEIVELGQQEYTNLFGGEWGGPTEPPPAIDPPVCGDSLWVPQGGACGMAMRGACDLATEIVGFWSKHGNGRPLTVCIPGGTCSTAVLVNVALQEILRQNKTDDNTLRSNGNDPIDIRIVVIPCVGDEKYARRQMMSLLESTWGERMAIVEDQIPTVLSPAPEGPRYEYFGQPNNLEATGYFRFGEPHEDILSTFREMDDEGISLDLIYGAPSWTILLRHFRTESKMRENKATFDPKAPLAGREIMYIHSGGLEGVNSQLMRYKYKGLVEDVQLPGRR